MGLTATTPTSSAIDMLVKKMNTQLEALTQMHTGFVAQEAANYLNKQKNKLTFTPSSDLEPYLQQVRNLLLTYEQLKIAFTSTLTKKQIREIESSVFAAVDLNQLQSTHYFPKFQKQLTEKISALTAEKNEINSKHSIRLINAITGIGFVVGFAIGLTLPLWIIPLVGILGVSFGIVMGLAVGSTLLIVMPMFLGMIPGDLNEKANQRIDTSLQTLNREGDADLLAEIQTQHAEKQRFFAAAKSCFSTPLAKFLKEQEPAAANDSSSETDDSSSSVDGSYSSDDSSEEHKTKIAHA